LFFEIQHFHISSNSTLRIQSNQHSLFENSFFKPNKMKLIKDNAIIVTKTHHTAEKFIQKKIELLVG